MKRKNRISSANVNLPSIVSDVREFLMGLVRTWRIRLTFNSHLEGVNWIVVAEWSARGIDSVGAWTRRAQTDPLWGELADADHLVTGQELEDEFGGTEFVSADFAWSLF